ADGAHAGRRAAALLRPRLGRQGQRGRAQRPVLPGPEARRGGRGAARLRQRRPRLRGAPERRPLRQLDAELRGVVARPGRRAARRQRISEEGRMRFNLRLHGQTKDGRACQADISVYADSATTLQDEAQKASENAAWHFTAAPQDWVPEGSDITVERLERLK